MRNYKTSLIVAGLVSVSMSASATINPVNGGYDVNFNADTAGQTPTVFGTYNTSQFHTIPRNFSDNTAVGDTVLVQSSYGGLNDNPVVLTNTDISSGAGGTTSIPQMEFGGGGGDVPTRYEFDISFESAGNLQDNSRFFGARFFGPGGGLVMLMTFRDEASEGNNSGDIVSDFGPGGLVSANSSWLYDEPSRIRVDLDRANNRTTWTIWNSLNPTGSVFVDNVVEAGSGGILGMQFRDMGGAQAVKAFEVGIDNIEIGMIPEPGSLALLALGAAALGLVRRRRI